MMTATTSIGLSAHGSARLPVMNLAAFWQQMLPSMPVLPVLPAQNRCILNNLAFDLYHGMEEVIGSIPIRSTNNSCCSHVVDGNARRHQPG
jgi:hypothetical protein